MAREREPDRELTAEERVAVLAYLRENPKASNNEACRHVGVARKNLKRDLDDDPEFREDYEVARGRGVERIYEAVDRLVFEGVKKPLVSAGKLVKDDDGNVVEVREYSERLTELLYRARTPEGKAMEARKLGIELNIPEGAVQIQSGVSTNDLLAMLQKVKGQPELEAPEGTGEVLDERDEPVD